MLSRRARMKPEQLATDDLKGLDHLEMVGPEDLRRQVLVEECERESEAALDEADLYKI